MATYTTGGLKVRLDPDALDEVIYPLKETGEIKNVLIDLDLWAMLPNGVSNLAALTVAEITGSGISVFVAAVCGYVVGGVLRGLVPYSSFIMWLFVMLGTGLTFFVPGSVATYHFAVEHGNATALAFAIVVVLNWCSVMDVLEAFVFPFNIVVSRQWAKYLGGNPMTWSERSFISLCGVYARRLGIELDWEAYDRAIRSSREKGHCD